MCYRLSGVVLAAAMVLAADGAMADVFGTGGNQFTIDFVTISGATNPASGYGIVNDAYRMGTYEITNDQWNKFAAAYGAVAGNPSDAYDQSPTYTGTNVPTNNVSWYETAQFVNWLNTSTGHHAAYKFTGTQGTSNYTFATWSTAEAANGTNLYRHKDAVYYLPTEDEWVKAAYWNGTTLQEYATKGGEYPTQGNGTSGTGWNYYTTHFATTPLGPWAVGRGSQELNGTYDMMGNVWEWMESPYSDTLYWGTSNRGLRGGSYEYYATGLFASYRGSGIPTVEDYSRGFRVAGVPEPGSITLLAVGAVGLLAHAWRRRRRAA